MRRSVKQHQHQLAHQKLWQDSAHQEWELNNLHKHLLHHLILQDS
jgi:hypothetical protein